MKIGEWVEVDNKIGFISFKNHFETAVKVKFGYRKSDVYSKKQLKPLNEQLNNEDIHNLQLLAVETNDEVWFEELGKLRT